MIIFIIVFHRKIKKSFELQITFVSCKPRNTRFISWNLKVLSWNKLLAFPTVGELYTAVTTSYFEVMQALKLQSSVATSILTFL